MRVLVETPEVEVSAKAQRRRFTAEYKRMLLQEADGCTKTGELAALLRHEGLYSSHVMTWRRQRERGELAGLAPKKRGPKARPVDERDREIADLKRQLARAEARIEKAEIIIEVQKKLGKLLGIEMPRDPREPKGSTGKS
jgi:transposase-like protein